MVKIRSFDVPNKIGDNEKVRHAVTKGEEGKNSCGKVCHPCKSPCSAPDPCNR